MKYTKNNFKSKDKMTFKPGNKFGVGSPGRTPIVSDEDLIELGKCMIKEILENEDWVFVQEFATSHLIPPNDLFNFANNRAVFKEYYDVARSILGHRIAKDSGKLDENRAPKGLHPSIAQRFLTTYFRDVKSTERELKQDTGNAIGAALRLIDKGTMDAKPVEREDIS